MGSSPVARFVGRAIGRAIARSVLGRPTSLIEDLRSDAVSSLIERHRTPDVRLLVQDDGHVIIEGEDGQPLPPRDLKLLRDKKPEYIRECLQEHVNKLNTDYEAAVNVHQKTPPPSHPSWLVLPSFDEPPPTALQPEKIGFIDRLLLQRRSIETDNARRLEDHERELDSWNARASEHLKLIDGRRLLGQRVAAGDPAAMEVMLGNILSTLPWARETNVCFDFGVDRTSLELDVDLPEIEDLPNRIASVATKGIRVNFKKRTDGEIRRDYMRLIHGTAFRVAGEAFANLPTVSTVTVSEFTQRPNPQTGQEIDVYILSVRIWRYEWETIEFGSLQNVDPIEALACFELVRSPDRTGKLRGITPLLETGEDRPNPIFVCVTCRSKDLSHASKGKIECNECGTTLQQVGEKYMLARVVDPASLVWRKYTGKALYSREWGNIAKGGLSDDEIIANVAQREAESD